MCFIMDGSEFDLFPLKISLESTNLEHFLSLVLGSVLGVVHPHTAGRGSLRTCLAGAPSLAASVM